MRTAFIQSLGTARIRYPILFSNMDPVRKFVADEESLQRPGLGLYKVPSSRLTRLVRLSAKSAHPLVDFIMQ